MSEGSRGGWKLVFRQDEIETMLAALEYVVGRNDWSLGHKDADVIDKMAHKLCKARVQEIIDYVRDLTG